MAPPSPHDFAKYLELSPGIDGASGRPLTSYKEDRTPLPRMSNELSACTSAERDIFNAQFIASYLPSFFRTLTQIPVDLELKSFPWNKKASWWLLVIAMFRNLVTFPSFQHFLREDASRAGDLFLFVYRTIANLPAHVFKRTPGEDWIPFLTILLSYIDALMKDIPLIYSSLSYPDLDVSIVEGLRRVHPLLRDLESQVPLPARAQYKTWVLIVGQYAQGTSAQVRIMEPKKVEVRSKSGLHWWCCEFSLTKAKKERAKCSDRGVMMACGRCRAVRYCSEGHQKLDWQKHKRLCFEPTW